MQKINICFLWHMHQPYYKDLVTGEYKLPWVRLHALKDYYGMVKVLSDFPSIHQTFNLVPCLIEQIEEYASGKARDRFLEIALKPTEELNQGEKEFALQYFFQANEEGLIGRYPRYAELWRAMQRCQNRLQFATSAFDEQMMRDLQVLSQLAWFDEEYLKNDQQIAALAEKGQNYSREEKALLGRKQLAAVGKVIGIYREFAARGQIELSTSPFYHPILPLLCDSNIASVSHPYLSLPSRFAYPGDAEDQLLRSREYFRSKFGQTPAGVWPSEGSVSDETLEIAARTGFEWIASDDGVLARSLGQPATPELAYRPYVFERNGQQILVIFRDHQLSDLIGFAYSRMEPAAAAEHFLTEIRRKCRAVLAGGHDALVPIILDGENAWEFYPLSGRPFLKELYGRIAADPQLAAVTVSEALSQIPATKITHVHPGSWVDSTFDIWIGAEEDNLAWEQLLCARKAFDRVLQSPPGVEISDEAKRLAREELMIAEGSDWCWWYGPEHSSANKAEFDQLYRNHLANVYRLLGEDIPFELQQPICALGNSAAHRAPSGLIQPVIDGEISSRQEWSDAGYYRLDRQLGAMHSQRSLIHDLRYGTDGQSVFLALAFTEPVPEHSPIEFRVRLRNLGGEAFTIVASGDRAKLSLLNTGLPEKAVATAFGSIFEMRVSLTALHARHGDPLFVQITLLRNDLPLALLPVSGELEMAMGLAMATHAG